MADLQFSWEVVSELTERLSRVAHELSEEEWALLLAVFATAADRVESGPDKTSGTLPEAEISERPRKIEDPSDENSEELREQLLHAYTPGPPPTVPIVFKVTPTPPHGHE